jgi:hypothetical protein
MNDLTPLPATLAEMARLLDVPGQLHEALEVDMTALGAPSRKPVTVCFGETEHSAYLQRSDRTSRVTVPTLEIRHGMHYAFLTLHDGKIALQEHSMKDDWGDALPELGRYMTPAEMVQAWTRDRNHHVMRAVLAASLAQPPLLLQVE